MRLSSMVADGLSRAIRPRSPPVLGAYLSDRASFVTSGVGSDPTPRRKRSVSKNDHDHENPTSCWQNSLDGGHPPRLFSITVRCPLGIRDGKIPKEHMFSGLRSIADIH